MAGSYRMIVDDNGDFCGIDLIENLGDAYEALEECFEMIRWLTGGDKQKIHQAWLEGYFKKHCPPENLRLADYARFWLEE